MAYCTTQNLIDRFGADELQILAGDEGGQLIQSKIDAAIEAATEQANSYIAARNKLPLDNVPSVLVDCVADLARYRLADDPDKMTRNIERRRDETVEWLKDIASGKAVLPGVREEKAVGGISVQARDQVFTQQTFARLM